MRINGGVADETIRSQSSSSPPSSQIASLSLALGSIDTTVVEPALNERRVHAMAVQIKRDIVGAAAGAQDQRVLSLPGRAAIEAFGMDDLSLEVLQTRQAPGSSG